MVRDGFGPIDFVIIIPRAIGLGVTKCLVSRNRLVVRKRIHSQWFNATIICIFTIAYEDYIRPLYIHVCVVYRRYYVAPSRISHI